MMKTKNKKQKRGFVVLFTVLIAAVMLAMAVGIANIALKQIVLSGSANDANKSFYAADSGIECALFHDLKILPSAFNPTITNPFTITCGGQNNIGVLNTGDSLLPYFESSVVYSVPGIQIPVGPNGEYCAYVVVDKQTFNETRVTSRGINAPCGESGPRVVERAIYVTY